MVGNSRKLNPCPNVDHWIGWNPDPQAVLQGSRVAAIVRSGTGVRSYLFHRLNYLSITDLVSFRMLIRRCGQLIIGPNRD